MWEIQPLWNGWSKPLSPRNMQFHDDFIGSEDDALLPTIFTPLLTTSLVCEVYTIQSSVFIQTSLPYSSLWGKWRGKAGNFLRNFLCFWAQGSFSGSHCIAWPGKVSFKTVLSALGGAAHFSESDVGTPEGAIHPAFPWEHSQEQAHPLWCFLTAWDRLAWLTALLACDYRYYDDKLLIA